MSCGVRRQASRFRRKRVDFVGVALAMVEKMDLIAKSTELLHESCAGLFTEYAGVSQLEESVLRDISRGSVRAGKSLPPDVAAAQVTHQDVLIADLTPDDAAFVPASALVRQPAGDHLHGSDALANPRCRLHGKSERYAICRSVENPCLGTTRPGRRV